MPAEFVAEIFLGGLGRFYLFMIYPNKEKRAAILKSTFAGHYSNAGRIIMLNVFYYTFGILLICLWLLVMGVLSWEGIKRLF